PNSYSPIGTANLTSIDALLRLLRRPRRRAGPAKRRMRLRPGLIGPPVSIVCESLAYALHPLAEPRKGWKGGLGHAGGHTVLQLEDQFSIYPTIHKPSTGRSRPRKGAGTAEFPSSAIAARGIMGRRLARRLQRGGRAVKSGGLGSQLKCMPTPPSASSARPP